MDQLLDPIRGFSTKQFGIGHFLPQLSETDVVVLYALGGILLRKLYIPAIAPAATAVRSQVFPQGGPP